MVESILLTDNNLYVNEGEIVVIVGPNGAGKSTAMKSILGNAEFNKWFS